MGYRILINLESTVAMFRVKQFDFTRCIPQFESLNKLPPVQIRKPVIQFCQYRLYIEVMVLTLP